MSLKVTRFWWVRHGPVKGFEGRVYDKRHVDCDVSNKPAFEHLAANLPKDAVWVVSDMKRAIQTAEAIGAGGYDLPEFDINPGIAEQDFGDWKGQYYKDIFAPHDDDQEYDFWEEMLNRRPPNGESFQDLMDRTGPAIEEIAAKYAGKDIVLASHGGTIRTAIGHAMGGTAPQAALFSIENLSTTRIDYITGGIANGWRVAFVNMRPGIKGSL